MTSNTDRTKTRENNSQNKQKSERRTDGAGMRENDCNINLKTQKNIFKEQAREKTTDRRKWREHG